jgi:hypothetical protein
MSSHGGPAGRPDRPQHTAVRVMTASVGFRCGQVWWSGSCTRRKNVRGGPLVSAAAEGGDYSLCHSRFSRRSRAMRSTSEKSGASRSASSSLSSASSVPGQAHSPTQVARDTNGSRPASAQAEWQLHRHSISEGRPPSQKP